ncbi:MAG: hypothetical protein A3J24_11050 [Deltaproteobacteria bacterium RIFCSPLOWO2_02_FULL_53_8]|nr:MAG: hypothetical protein A3J24_11050 [Deltaproteobacteria bacterium RIFCSPLOWO2_02_FULL_53_8]
MVKKYYNLTVICEGAMPDFTLDEKAVDAFEKAFIDKEEVIKFVDMEDKGEVRLRNRKLVGYKKAQMTHLPKGLKDL